MTYVWTDKRRKLQSRMMRRINKSKLNSSPEGIEANRQRAIERQSDPEFRKRHKKACQQWADDNQDKIVNGARSRSNEGQIRAAKDPARRARVAAGQKKNWDTNPNRKKLMSQFKKQWWQSLADDDKQKMVEKIMASNGISPNKSETRMIRVFARLGYGYEFTGAGSEILAGHIPDFVDHERKEVIEFNGIYWHKHRDRDKSRACDYARLGYRCLLVYYEVVNRSSIHKIVEAIRLFQARRGKSRYSPICMATCS